MWKKFIKHTKKDLGQNFIINNSVLEKIISFVNLEGKNVTEIGPGIGNLTKLILEKSIKSLTVIEKDEFYAKELDKLYGNKVKIINGDCLDFKLETDVIIGNLPYYVATEFIYHSIYNNQYDEMLIMVQKEVADRITSTHNSKTYGKLSVICQLSSSIIKKCMALSPSTFYPAPKVFSTLLYIKRNPLIVPKFSHLDYIFQNRRKKFSNILCNCPEDLKDLRPENISPNDYLKWSKIFV
jgi:16S rRNA (adenine1518-N6/adenine1519-N6)-dimethyltransferase